MVRAGVRSLGWALALLLGGCGEPEPTRTAPEQLRSSVAEPPASYASVPRAERMARAAAELERHAGAVAANGLAPGLVEAAQRALAASAVGDYYLQPPFALRLRDLRFFLKWNAPPAEEAGAPAVPDPRRWAPQRDAIVAMAGQLAERDIDLLVVPIPRPHQLYPERVDPAVRPGADFVGVDPCLTAFLSELVAADVEVVHLTPHFARERDGGDARSDRHLFHDVNQHWTNRAVVLTADLIADRVRELPWFEPGPLRAGRDWTAASELVPFEMPQPEGEPLATEVWVDVVRRDRGEPRDVRDRTSPILLLGDSNTRWYEPEQAAIGDQLVARLGRGIDVVAMPTTDAVGVWRSVLRRRAKGQLETKRLVIWLLDAAKLGHDNLVELELFGG